MTNQKTPFEIWWDTEGSEAPKKGDDLYEHCKRMCEIAWKNGAYVKEQNTCAPELLDALELQTCALRYARTTISKAEGGAA